MAVKSVLVAGIVMVAVVMAQTALKRREADEILFRGSKMENETESESAENSTAIGDDVTEAPKTRLPGPPPIRIGPWMVLGCHNNDDTWGCELRRMLHASTIGIIDSLKFTVRKDKSLKVQNVKEPCDAGDTCNRKSGRFNIIVKCPKSEGCSSAVMRRVKTAYFQCGFLVGFVVMLACMLLCVCFCKAVVNADRPEQKPIVRVQLRYNPRKC